MTSLEGLPAELRKAAKTTKDIVAYIGQLDSFDIDTNPEWNKLWLPAGLAEKEMKNKNVGVDLSFFELITHTFAEVVDSTVEKVGEVMFWLRLRKSSNTVYRKDGSFFCRSCGNNTKKQRRGEQR